VLDEFARENELPDIVAAALRARDDTRRQLSPRNGTDEQDYAELGATLRLKLIAAEREYVYQLLREGKITDESRRRIEHELDLEEASIQARCAAGELPL
jgi:CPA1 family monovalent cation:H+ antiporter